MAAVELELVVGDNMDLMDREWIRIAPGAGRRLNWTSWSGSMTGEKRVLGQALEGLDVEGCSRFVVEESIDFVVEEKTVHIPAAEEVYS